MSWDFTVVCDRCKKFRHLGQHMGGRNSFGYGSNDEEGRLAVADFIVDHLYLESCGTRELRIVSTDNIPIDYEDDDQRWKKEL